MRGDETVSKDGMPCMYGAIRQARSTIELEGHLRITTEYLHTPDMYCPAPGTRANVEADMVPEGRG